MTQPAAEAQAAYDELCADTWTRMDGEFIHQYVVDAFAAQHADAQGKPIGITFALVGLYLAVEHGLTGREVQQAHMKLARRRQPWPTFDLPDERGDVTVADVMAADAGEARDQAIRNWCASVWAAFAASRGPVEALLKANHLL